jgi:hypothetical protein
MVEMATPGKKGTTEALCRFWYGNSSTKKIMPNIRAARLERQAASYKLQAGSRKQEVGSGKPQNIARWSPAFSR